MNAQRPELARLAAVLPLSLVLALAACSKPTPPDKDQPPEPKATGLRDTIQAPIDKAKAVEPQVLDAARQQQAEIDAQTGGGEATRSVPGN
ncbi:MAG: hypothetical protein ACTHKZ_03480 [Lysobacteraceae bacterium]